MSRDGETGEEQRASEVTDREARANAAPRGVAFVRLGDAVPSGGYSSSFVTHAFVAGSGGTPMDVVALPPAAQWIHLMRPPL